ncbi:MAG: hypothetical protein LBI96_00820 [Odoribacteraceae bacterium]|nr:hypothetical protein [Odoribacteraceae bacterium]
MIQAILYKEWIKSRRALLLATALMAGYVAYAAVHAGQIFRVDGAVAAWATLILKDAFPLPAAGQWLPLLAGVLVGLSQYVPEMVDKRLKLTLHLPLPERRVLSVMLLHGVATLLALYAATILAAWAILAGYYPPELLAGFLWRALPWFTAGIAGYLCTAWACIEPAWTRRLTNAVIATGALSAFYLDAPAGGYLPMLPWLALLTAAAFCLPFHSAARFKEGAR